MDSLFTIIKLVTKHCFMASVDMKDAYYSVPIRLSDRKYLCFIWEGNLYQFTCIPNGLSCAPQIFTKILKPLLSTLHRQGHIAVAHLDDLYLQGQTCEKCVQNVIDTTVLFDKLGLEEVHFHTCTSAYNDNDNRTNQRESYWFTKGL